MKVKCPDCGEWDYKGKRRYSPKHSVWVSCPTCHKNIKLQPPKKEKEESNV